METKCNLGWHSVCIFCDSPIFASVSHVHSWNKKRGGHEQYCGACYATILAAAKLVLESIQATRGTVNLPDVDLMLDHDEVIVLVQAEFKWPDASN